MPSMVVISDSAGTRFMVVVQERTTLPFRITEQEPHWPCPQATLVPVRPSCPRSTWASFWDGSHMTTVGTPLMVSSFFSTPTPLRRECPRRR